MLDDSMQKVSAWVHSKPKGVRIPWDRPIVKFFPKGPYDEEKERIDIVAVTPEGTSCPMNPNHFLNIFCIAVEAMRVGVAELRYMKGKRPIIPLFWVHILTPYSTRRTI